MLASALAMAVLVDGPTARAQPASAADSDSDADALRVDLATYVGWRTFQRHCATCHGADAQGSRFAPELGPRVRRLTRDTFLDAMRDGYPGVTVAGIGPWADDPDVRRYAEAIWVYLTARASGALPPGALAPPLAGSMTDG